MIKRLQIKNYKSLQNIEIELGNFNVLVAPNASGKSNLLDSLAFLSRTAYSPIANPVEERGGFNQLTFCGLGGNIEFSLDVSLDEEPYSYFFSFNDQAIIQEQLTAADKSIVSRDTHDRAKILTDNGEIKNIGPSPTDSVIGQLGEYSTPGSKFRDYLASWRLYQPLASEIKKTAKAQKSFDLRKGAENLAQVLISLHNERPRDFRKVEDLLKQGIPEIEELLTPLTTDGQTYVAVKEKGLEYYPIHFQQLSDGTLKLLSYVTVAALPESKLLCFEEPENFIHARLLKLLVDILKASGKQVILSTHSPYLVDFVEPEDVVVTEKEGNATKLSKVEDAKMLKQKLEELELQLGEYYYSGSIGGVP